MQEATWTSVLVAERLGRLLRKNSMIKKRNNTLDNTPLRTLQNNMANEFTIVCGLIKGYLWTQEDGKLKYNASQDKDVSGMLQNCNEIGDIKSIPDIAGVLVFMSGHVGIYIGNGEVIEAKGHA